MKKLHGKNLEECIQNLEMIRRYKPFEYGGKWFIGFVSGEGLAYRTKKPLINRATKANLKTLEIVELR